VAISPIINMMTLLQLMMLVRGMIKTHCYHHRALVTDIGPQDIAHIMAECQGTGAMHSPLLTG